MLTKKRRCVLGKQIRSDDGLTLETSAFQIFHGANSTNINSFDNMYLLTE